MEKQQIPGNISPLASQIHALISTMEAHYNNLYSEAVRLKEENDQLKKPTVEKLD